MNISCGIDIIEIDRIKDALAQEGFMNRVFTEKEIEYCESKKTQKYQSYAGKFAAKEAVFKAISKLLENKYAIDWKEIEILNDEQGKTQALISNNVNKKIQSIDISISHCKLYATANAVIIY